MRLEGITRLRLIATALVLAFLAYGPRASAGESSVSVESYAVVTGCPGEVSFRAQVEQRASRRALTSPKTIKVAIGIERHDRAFRGTIDVTDAEGALSTRKMTATRCDELVSMLALVAVLALEPVGRARPDAAPETTRSAVPVGVGSVERGDDSVETTRSEVDGLAPKAQEPSPQSPLLTSALGEPSKAEDRGLTATIRQRGGRSHTPAVRLAAYLGAQRGASPDVAMTAGVFAELGFDDRRAGGGLLRLEPSVRLGGVVGASDRTSVGNAAAEFRWTTGAIDLCPIGIHVTRANVAPCARFELGALEAQGERITPARADARLWVAAALPVRLRFDVSPHVFLELEGAARVALVRDTFVFRPDVTIFETPLFGYSAAFGGGMRIP